MKLKILSLSLISFAIVAQECPCPTITCPDNAAKFCNVNAENLCVTKTAKIKGDTQVSGDFLVCGDSRINGDLTVCGTLFANCTCCYNDELNFSAHEMTAQDEELNPEEFEPYPPLTLKLHGWELTTEDSNTITAEFEVPEDFDARIAPQVDFHFLVPGVIELLSTRAVGNANFNVYYDSVSNGNVIPASFTQTTTGDVSVQDAPAIPQLFHRVVTVTLDTIFNPQDFAQVSIQRTEAEDDEFERPVYLSAVSFRYRKLECPEVLV